MAHIRVIHDPVGETLTVYWAEPRTDQICEETGEGIILIKDAKTHEVIGFERLYYRQEPGAKTITVETRDVTLWGLTGIRMKISYDAEVDALSITFRETTVTTKHLAEGIAADYDAEGQLAGLEILDAVKRFGGEETLRQVVIEGIGPATRTWQIDSDTSTAIKTRNDKTRLQREIDATDRQIDQLVYELYGLTEEEIKTVEEAT